jgi:hypothetical protein
MKTKPRRVPRPLGLTIKAQHLGTLTDPNQKQEKLKELHLYIIQYYILNDYTICKQYKTYQQLAQYLNIDEEVCMSYVVKCMKKNTELFDKIDAQEQTRELIFSAQKKGLEIQALALNQVAILSRTQGDTYKPFVSGELNKSIANVISHNKNQADFAFKYLDALLRIMGAQKDGQAMPLMGTKKAQEGTQFLSVSDALSLISQHNPRESWNEDMVKALMGPEGTQFPDVRAATQDLRAIGIRHDGTQSLPQENKASEGNGTPEDGPDHKHHHENRRQSDLNILDEDEVYED